MIMTPTTPPYDPYDMDAAIAYSRETKRIFKSGDLNAAFAHYKADPNGGATPGLQNMTIKEFSYSMHSKSGGHAAALHMAPAERQAWSESGATDAQIDELASMGGYAKITTDPVKASHFSDMLLPLLNNRLDNVRDALKERGWFHPNGNRALLTLLLTDKLRAEDVALTMSADWRTIGSDPTYCGLTYHVLPKVGNGACAREFHFYSLQDQMLISADEIADNLTEIMLQANVLRMRAQEPRTENARIIPLPPDQWRAEYKDVEPERSIAAGKALITAVAHRLGGAFAEWQASGTNWEFTDLTIDGECIRIGVSTGAVVQVNRDPFTPAPEREMNTNEQAVLRSVMAALPMPLAQQKMGELLSEGIDAEINAAYTGITGNAPDYAKVFDWVRSDASKQDKAALELASIAAVRGMIGIGQHQRMREYLNEQFAQKAQKTSSLSVAQASIVSPDAGMP